MKRFKAAGWIHPKGMGDDCQFTCDVEAPDMASARAEIVRLLKRWSAVTNDFVITEVPSLRVVSR